MPINRLIKCHILLFYLFKKDVIGQFGDLKIFLLEQKYLCCYKFLIQYAATCIDMQYYIFFKNNFKRLSVGSF